MVVVERSDFPNAQLRAVGGVSGGHRARLAERLSELSNTGGWRGRWWLTRAKRQRSDLTRPSGWLVGGDGGTDAGWKNRIGGKAPAAYLRGSFSRTTNTAPKNYDCDENDCAPSRQGARPARQDARNEVRASAGGRAFAAARPEEAGTSGSLRGMRWQR